VAERQSISVAGAILLYKDYPKAQSQWIRPVVHPGLWRPDRIFCNWRCCCEQWGQIALLRTFWSKFRYLRRISLITLMRRGILWV